MNKQLPPRPNLEQLKKQAKDLRKAHQSALAEAAKSIAEHLPRLAGSSEEEILAADLSLQEAQHVVAGEYGFKSWNWLQAVVEIDYDLLAKLSDREVQILLREVDQKDLVLSLKKASDELRDKLLGNMSKRVRTFITEEMELLGPVPSSEVAETQQRVLRQTALLAVDGWIDWPNGVRSRAAKPPVFQPDPGLASLFARSLDQLTTDEIAEVWKGLAIQARDAGILSLEPAAQRIESPFAQEALRLAVDGTEPALIRDILATRLEQAILSDQKKRGQMVIEALMAIRAGDNPRIIGYRLGAFCQSEPSETNDRLRKVPVEDLAARLRDRPYAQMELDQITALFTDMGHLARREGVAALTALIEATDYPLLRRGLEMIRDKTAPEQFVEAIVSQLDEELRQTEVRHRMVIVGIEGIQAAKKPNEIAEMVKQAGVS